VTNEGRRRLTCRVRVDDGKGEPRPAVILHDHGDAVTVVYGTGTVGRDIPGLTITNTKGRFAHQFRITKPTAFYASNEVRVTNENIVETYTPCPQDWLAALEQAIVTFKKA
jgi:hypothetical protein